MPSITPRSPFFVKKAWSPIKPKRLICSLRQPASRYFFRARFSLNTGHLANVDRGNLGRVVLTRRLGRIEQKPENLRVGPGGPAGKPVKQGEHQDSPQKRVQQVEDPGSHDQSKEKELPLGSHKRERSIKRAENGIDAAFHGFEFPVISEMRGEIREIART